MAMNMDAFVASEMCGPTSKHLREWLNLMSLLKTRKFTHSKTVNYTKIDFTRHLQQATACVWGKESKLQWEYLKGTFELFYRSLYSHYLLGVAMLRKVLGVDGFYSRSQRYGDLGKAPFGGLTIINAITGALVDVLYLERNSTAVEYTVKGFTSKYSVLESALFEILCQFIEENLHHDEYLKLVTDELSSVKTTLEKHISGKFTNFQHVLDYWHVFGKVKKQFRAVIKLNYYFQVHYARLC